MKFSACTFVFRDTPPTFSLAERSSILWGRLACSKVTAVASESVGRA